MSEHQRPAISRAELLELAAGFAGAGAFVTPERRIGAFDRGADVRVTIDRSRTRGVLRPQLAGLSFEKVEVTNGLFDPSNAALVGCFKRLGPGVVRIGGNTADVAVWVPNGNGKWSGHVAPANVDSLAGFLKATGWRAIYGVNLARNTPEACAAEMQYAARALGDGLAGIEIGNECDLYAKRGVRPATYTVDDFVAEWKTYAGAIRAVVPNAAFVGPASASGLETWTKSFIAAVGPELQQITQHYYNGDARSPASTVDALLKPSRYLERTLGDLEDYARQFRIPGGHRLGEANSYYNGGTSNVSNAYGVALWTIDFLFANALHGSSGVNFHCAQHAPYSPIVNERGTIAGVGPGYYGMLLASKIAPGPLYGVTVNSQVNASAYAVAGSDSALYVVVLNKDGSTPVEVSVDTGGAASHAVLLDLAGPALDALQGATLGGQSIGPDGRWSNSVRRSARARGGVIDVRVQPASAVLMKVT